MTKNEQEQPNQQKSFESVLADIKQKLNNVYRGKNIEEMHNRIAEFGYKLMDKYSDCRNYILFHVLIGSTPPSNATIKEDFPGEDSIIKFIKNL